ncbi:PTS system mannose-specific EIIC component [Serratia fonticola]|uniref:PTS system mannose-specific EIIC component n=1 Tax=Serratia fonticola TaxID=47917 RepID=A0A4U9UMZ8_SERFO|nr:PTS system mannose-specific EIIC component [Serratia fonticola]
MLMEAILVAIWAGICSMDDVGPQMLRRPLLTGTVAGIIMGDMVQGLAISATLELMWMGIGNVGAYSAPDIIAGSIIGVALGIASKGGIGRGYRAGSSGLYSLPATADRLALFCQLLKRLGGEIHSIGGLSRPGQGPLFLDAAVVLDPCRSLLLGNLLWWGPGQQSVRSHTGQHFNRHGVASKMIPAIGVCILLLMLLKGRMWFFFLLGFILTTYLKLPIIPITFIALAFAVLYDMAYTNGMNTPAPEKSKATATDTEEEYDL